jgi:hypothetical protein
VRRRGRSTANRYAAGSRDMAKRLTITFPGDRPDDFYDTVYWFAEKLVYPIVHAGLGELSDIEKGPLKVIWIDLADAHNLGQVKKLVRKLLAHHKLTIDAVVSVT